MSTSGTLEKAADKAHLKGASTPKVSTTVKYVIETFDRKKTEFGMC